MLEMLIIAVLVMWSIYVVFKKIFPKTYHSVFQTLSLFCERQGWTQLARWLKPQIAGGCGGNCACPANEVAKPENKRQAVKWK